MARPFASCTKNHLGIIWPIHIYSLLRLTLTEHQAHHRRYASRLLKIRRTRRPIRCARAQRAHFDLVASLSEWTDTGKRSLWAFWHFLGAPSPPGSMQRELDYSGWGHDNSAQDTGGPRVALAGLVKIRDWGSSPNPNVFVERISYIYISEIPWPGVRFLSTQSQRTLQLYAQTLVTMPSILTAKYDWILAITTIAFVFSAFGNGANDVANSYASKQYSPGRISQSNDWLRI